MFASDCRGFTGDLRARGGEGDGVGANLLPFAQRESMRRKEGTYGRAVPPQHIFQDGYQHGERVVTEDAPSRHVADVAILGDGDGEAPDVVDVQHHVQIARAIAHINDAVLTDAQIRAQLFYHSHFSVAGGQAHDGCDFAGRRIVAEARANDVTGRHHAFQRGLHDLFRGGRNHIAGTLVAVDVVEQFHQARDIGFQADALAHFDEVLAAYFAVFRVERNRVI